MEMSAEQQPRDHICWFHREREIDRIIIRLYTSSINRARLHLTCANLQPEWGVTLDPSRKIRNTKLEGKAFLWFNPHNLNLDIYSPVGQAGVRNSLHDFIEQGGYLVEEADHMVPVDQDATHEFDLAVNKDLDKRLAIYLNSRILGPGGKEADDMFMDSSELERCLSCSSDHDRWDHDKCKEICANLRNLRISSLEFPHDFARDDVFFAVLDQDASLDDTAAASSSEQAVPSESPDPETNDGIIDSHTCCPGPAPAGNVDTEKQSHDAQRAAVLDGIAKNNATKIPGVFSHGVRYIRDSTGSNINAPECRTIIVTHVSENIDLSSVLAQLRGKVVIEAMFVRGLPGYGHKAAVVQFSRHECARAIFQHYTDHPLRFMGGENNDEAYEAGIILPDTDTYPILRHLNHALERGVTRHMEFRMPLKHVYEIILNADFGFRDFGNVITGFTDVSQTCYRVEMSSISMAERIQLAYLTSELNTTNGQASEDSAGPVSRFIPDSCDQVLDTLPEVGSPTLGAQLAIEFYELLWNREGIRPGFQTDFPETIHVRLPLPTSPADTWWMNNKILEEDALPDAVREVTADWAAPDIERWTGPNKEGRLCRWSRDPRSGAERFEVFLSQDGGTEGPVASPTMYRDQLTKEWLHYNIDSENPETQRALDEYFKANGLLNLRKVNEYIRRRKSPPAGN